MDWQQILSSLIGGGIVAAMGGFIFLRFVSQFDKMSEKIDKVAEQNAEISKDVAVIKKNITDLEELEAKSQENRERIVVLESRILPKSRRFHDSHS